MGKCHRGIDIHRKPNYLFDRSDVHFWQHGRIGDSMVVRDEVQHRPFAADLLTY